jgi:hypothetical protein
MATQQRRDREDEFLRRVEAGESRRALSVEYGLSYRYFSYCVQRAKTRRRVALMREAVRRVGAGESVEAVAAATGIDAESIEFCMGVSR